MKTQNFKQHIKIAILTAITIAFITPAANAQRRENDNNNRKSQRVEQSKNVKSKESAKNNTTYRRPSENKNDETFLKNKQQVHNNQYKHQNKKQRDNRNSHNHWEKDYGHNNNIHVHISHPAINYWDIHPHPHIRFKKLPRKAIWVFLDGENYFVHHGKFYTSSPFGYYRVKPPKYIHQLPNGCNTVWVKGRKFFDYHGVLFIDTPLGFKIIAS